MTTRTARLAAVAVLAVATAGAVALAEEPGQALAEAAARQTAADQKATAAVADTLKQAERAAKTNPAKALQLLKAAQNDLDTAVLLSSTTRQTLTAQLKARIDALGGRPALADGKAVAVNKAADLQKFREELKAVAEGVERIKFYEAKGDSKSAAEVVARLAATYPDNPSVLTLTQRGSTATAVLASQAFAKEQNERLVAVGNDLMRSSLPPKGDIEFPADWKKRDHRKKLNQIELTAKEKSLIEALDKPVSVLFRDRPLEEVLQDLSNQLNQPLVVDTKSLKDLDIDLKRTVSLDAKGIPARMVLRQILGSAGLQFVVKEETIQVVTAERARDMLATRVYYLGDVVQGVGPFSGSLTWGPFLDYEQTVNNVRVIIDAIQQSVDPLSWQSKGGTGTITFHFPSMSLIVRASTEVHAALGSKLGGGK